MTSSSRRYRKMLFRAAYDFRISLWDSYRKLWVRLFKQCTLLWAVLLRWGMDNQRRQTSCGRGDHRCYTCPLKKEAIKCLKKDQKEKVVKFCLSLTTSGSESHNRKPPYPQYMTFTTHETRFGAQTGWDFFLQLYRGIVNMQWTTHNLKRTIRWVLPYVHIHENIAAIKAWPRDPPRFPNILSMTL